MAGPITAAMRSGLAPSSTMASTVASTMPESAPRQPAWAAPMTRASPSQKRTGAQSAVRTPMARPGVAVTMASASGALAGLPRLLGDHGIGAVLLKDREQTVRLRAQDLGDARAVLRHVRRVIARAGAAIERGIEAARDAALAGEESVADAVDGSRGSRRRTSSCRVSPWRGRRSRLNVSEGRRRGKPARLVSASTLNSSAHLARVGEPRRT